MSARYFSQYGASTILAGLLSYGSLGWIHTATSPTPWMKALAALSCLLCLFLLSCFYSNFSFLFLSTAKRSSRIGRFLQRFIEPFTFVAGIPGTRFKAFEHFVSQLPELGGHIRTLENYVRRRELVPGTEPYERLIEETEFEFKTYMRQYYLGTVLRFFKNFIFTIFCVILCFSFLFLCESTLVGGGANVLAGSTAEDFGNVDKATWIMESIYFSTMSFATIGFGEIYPKESPFPRTLSILEALTCMFSLSIGFGFMSTLISSMSINSPKDHADVLRDELERLAGGKRLG